MVRWLDGYETPSRMTSPQEAHRAPEDDPLQPHAAAPERQGRPRLRARRQPLVLVVDDSLDVRELYRQYFEFVGFRVLTAADGEEALELARRVGPDLIVLDLSMPRLNGVAVTHQLRQDHRTQHIPIIILTGYAARAIEHGVLESGADVFLTKPCLPEDLETHVRRLLGARPSGSRHAG